MIVKKIVSKILDSNTFVITEGSSAIIIDAGAELDMIKENLNGEKVVGIFLTHPHFDHVMYCNEYANYFDCNIYVGEDSEEYFLDPEKNCSENLVIDDFSKFKFLHGEGDIELGELCVHYITCGGHSKVDILYKLGNDFFVGDSLIGRSVGRMDLYGGDKQNTIKTLETILNQDYEIMHCGHGDDFDKTTQDRIAKTWINFLSKRDAKF